MDHSNCVSKQDYQKLVDKNTEINEENVKLKRRIAILEREMEELRIQRYLEYLHFEMQSYSSCGSFVQAYSSWQS